MGTGPTGRLLGAGMNGVVRALATSDGILYAGGDFTTAGGVAATGIAQWDGTNWAPVGSGLSGTSPVVYTLAASGSNLYVGGSFTNAGGLAANYIAQWNGAKWSRLGAGAINQGVGMNQYGYVFALTVAGGTLYAGGDFSSAVGVAASGVAAWDGTNWSALGSGVDPGNYVYAPGGARQYAIHGRPVRHGGRKQCQ